MYLSEECKCPNWTYRKCNFQLPQAVTGNGFEQTIGVCLDLRSTHKDTYIMLTIYTQDKYMIPKQSKIQPLDSVHHRLRPKSVSHLMVSHTPSSSMAHFSTWLRSCELQVIMTLSIWPTKWIILTMIRYQCPLASSTCFLQKTRAESMRRLRNWMLSG